MSVPERAYSYFDIPEDSDAHCEEGGPRACDQLLTDPVGAMLDPSRRPNHVCGDVLLELVDRWKSYRFYQVFGTDTPDHGIAWDLDPDGFSHLFPEVGRETLRKWVRGYRVFEERDLGLAVQEGPATLITPILARVGEARVVFLGLGTWPEGRGTMSRADDGSVVGFSLPVARGAFVQVEGTHLDKEVVRVVNALQQWWASVSGSILSGRRGAHRPRLPIPYEPVAAIYREMLADYRGERMPTMADLVEAIKADDRLSTTTLSTKTLARRIADWQAEGRPWPPS